MAETKEEVIVFTNDSDFGEFIKEGKCVIDFFATWCQPCKFIAPIFLDLSKKYTDLKFGKVDVDAIQDAKVSMVPTFKFYENGKELEKKVTGMNLENLKLCVEKFHNGELS